MSDETPNANNNQAGLSFDRLAAIFAIGVSFAAMAISLLEVSSIRAQQKAEVWPYIEIDQSYTSEGYELRLTNKGVGPALMSDVVLLAGGAPVSDLDAFIADTVGEADAFSYDIYFRTDPSGGVVAPGETYTLFGVPWTDATRRFIENASDEIDIKTCFCSIYEECWTATFRSRRPEVAQSCPQPSAE